MTRKVDSMRNKLLAIVGDIAIFAMTGITSAQNLLTNADFEDGTTNGWSTWTWGDGALSTVNSNVWDDGNWTPPPHQWREWNIRSEL